MRRGGNLSVRFIKLVWSVGMLAAVAPFWLFMKAVEVIRVGLGLIIIIIVLGLFWESGLIQGLWQGEESARTSRAGGEARRDRARARQEALDGRAAPRGGGRMPSAIPLIAKGDFARLARQRMPPWDYPALSHWRLSGGGPRWYANAGQGPASRVGRKTMKASSKRRGRT